MTANPTETGPLSPLRSPPRTGDTTGLRTPQILRDWYESTRYEASAYLEEHNQKIRTAVENTFKFIALSLAFFINPEFFCIGAFLHFLDPEPINNAAKFTAHIFTKANVLYSCMLIATFFLARPLLIPVGIMCAGGYALEWAKEQIPSEEDSEEGRTKVKEEERDKAETEKKFKKKLAATDAELKNETFLEELV